MSVTCSSFTALSQETDIEFVTDTTEFPQTHKHRIVRLFVVLWVLCGGVFCLFFIKKNLLMLCEVFLLITSGFQ